MHPRKWMASFWNCILQLQLKVCFFEGEMRLTEWTQFSQLCHLFWGLSTVDSRNTYTFPMIAFSIYISFFEISLNFFIHLNSKYRDEQISVLTRRQTRITEHLGSWWQKCKGNLASRFWSAIISFSSSHCTHWIACEIPKGFILLLSWVFCGCWEKASFYCLSFQV